MTELEIEKSKNVQLLTQCVLLRGEIVTLKEALARERRENGRLRELERDDSWDDRTQAEIDRAEKGEHDADCERSEA